MEKKKRSSSLPVKSNAKVPKNNLKRACKSIPDACLKWSSPKPLFELHWVNSFIFFKFLVLFPWDFMFFYCEIISNLQESDKSSTRDSWIPLTSITWMWIFYHIRSPYTVLPFSASTTPTHACVHIYYHTHTCICTYIYTHISELVKSNLWTWCAFTPKHIMYFLKNRQFSYVTIIQWTIQYHWYNTLFYIIKLI